MEESIPTLSGGMRESRLVDDQGNPGPSSFSADMPFSYSLAFSAVVSDATAGNGTLQPYAGQRIGLNPSSDNTAILLVSMGDASNFQRILPGQFLEALTPFDRFFLKRPNALASSALLYYIDVASGRARLNYSTTPQPTTSSGTGTGATQVQGNAADGAAGVGNPVVIAGLDPVNVQALLTDTTGRPNVVGAAASGAAKAGNPVLVAGQDGTNAETLLTDTAGRLNVVGAIANAGTAAGNPVLVAGSDNGGLVRQLHVVVGGQAATAAGNLLMIGNRGASDGFARSNAGDVRGAQIVAGTTAAASAAVAAPITVGGVDGSANVQNLLTDTGGRLVTNGSSTAAAALTGGLAVVAGLDAGSLTRSLPVAVGGAAASANVLVTGNRGAADGFARSNNGDVRGSLVVVGTTAVASAVVANPATVGGVDTAGNVQNLLMDTGGRVQLADSSKPTYSAAITGLAPNAAATDIFTIAGSASKTVKVKRLSISGVATATGAFDVILIKRSSADTAGTSTSPTVIPHDSSDAAGTAAVKAYTVNPTLGTTVGTMKAATLTVVTALTPAVPADPIVWEFGNMRGEGIVLRGTAQQLAINLVAQTIAGNLLDIDVEWTEE